MWVQHYSDGDASVVSDPSPSIALRQLESAFVRESRAKGEIVHVIGEVDIASSGQLEEAISEAFRGGTAVIVDLDSCSYIDSTTLNVLIRANQSHPGRFFIVVPPNGSVRRLFAVTDLLDRLPIVGAIEELG